MNFLGYAESSARLLNADLPDVAALRDHLSPHEWLQERATERDCVRLRRFQLELRPIFLAANHGDKDGVVSHLNELMSRYPIRPRLSEHEDQLHLHVANAVSVAELLISESLLGLASLMVELGINRFGFCAATPCTNVFVDVSPNMSRRYCSDRCSSRANVARFRARRRAQDSQSASG